MEYFSHKNPDKLLYDHLLEVYHYAMEANVELKSWEKEALQIICLCHDFGKFTTFFQSHLSGVSSKHSQHGFLSAIFGVFLLDAKERTVFTKDEPTSFFR